MNGRWWRKCSVVWYLRDSNRFSLSFLGHVFKSFPCIHNGLCEEFCDVSANRRIDKCIKCRFQETFDKIKVLRDVFFSFWMDSKNKAFIKGTEKPLGKMFSWPLGHSCLRQDHLRPLLVLVFFLNIFLCSSYQVLVTKQRYIWKNYISK